MYYGTCVVSFEEDSLCCMCQVGDSWTPEDRQSDPCLVKIQLSLKLLPSNQLQAGYSSVYGMMFSHERHLSSASEVLLRSTTA